MSHTRAYNCALCGAACHASAAPLSSGVLAIHKGSRQRQPCACFGCGVIIYCCKAHRRIHRQLPGDGGGHDAVECSRMAAQLQRGARLATSFPFPWARGLCRLPELEPEAACHPAEAQSSGGSEVVGGAPPSGPGRMGDTTVAAEGDGTPPAWKDLSGRRYSVCQLLQAAWNDQGERSSSSIGSATRDCSGTGRCSTAVEPGPPAVKRCPAEGVWRRLCSCRTSAEVLPWGSCQLPDLGSWYSASTPGAADAAAPPLGLHSTVQAARVVGGESLSCPAVVGLRGACTGSRSGDGGESSVFSSSSKAPWDHESWARRVWRLPATLAPPFEAATAPSLEAQAAVAEAAAPGAANDWRSALPSSSGAGVSAHPAPAGAADARQLQQPPVSPYSSSSTSPASAAVVGWRSYYQWAGLPLQSPASLLLHFPLTLFRALSLADERTGGLLLGGSGSTCRSMSKFERQQHVPAGQPCTGVDDGKASKALGAERACKRPRHIADLEEQHAGATPAEHQPSGHQQEERLSISPSASGSRDPTAGHDTAAAADVDRVVDVLYLGPQAELDCLDCFAALLPMLARGSTLRVRMVGPDVPREWHAAQLAYDSRGVTAGRAALTTDLAADEAAEASQQPAGGLQAQSSGREGRGRGGQQGMAQSGNTRIEFSFWSCPLHEAPESLLRDCLFAPTAPHREELSASIPSMPSAQASAAEQLQSPQSAGQAVPADARPLLPPPLPPPLVVLAPNAGLPAYMSWLPSLELLVAASSSRSRTSGTPAATPLAPVDGGADATAGDGDVGRARNGSGGGGSNDGAGGGQGCGRICSEVVAGVADWCKRLEDLKGHGNGNGGSGNDSLVLRPLYCMFTAFNEEEVLRSEQMLSQLYGVVQDVACAENPFMQPLWCVERAGNALPSFSNGFMFGWCADGVGGR